MSDFKLLLLICGALYASECFVWVPSGSLLFLSWSRLFSLARGPAFRLRNPWPGGFAYRFDPSSPFPQAPSLNSNGAKARWQNFQGQRKVLLGLGRGLLSVCAGAFLLYVVRKGFTLAWILLFAAFLSLHLSIAVLFWKKFGNLFPGDKARKIKKTLLCALSPFQSIRAVDLLEENLFLEFHPLVVGRLLLEEADFKGLCRRWILEIRYPGETRQDRESDPLLLSPSRTEEEKLLDRWMGKQGIQGAKVLQPLEPSHPSNLAYCQRCETEYRVAGGRCNDCGRNLVSFRASF